MAAFPLGVALAEIEMQQPALARAVPIAVGVVVLLAGALQFTAWKARQLMAVVMAAITVERLAPAGERVARAMGAVVVGAELILIARAAGLG